MAKLVQQVSFSDKEIRDLLIEKAKEQIKTETGKEPTGSSRTNLIGQANGQDCEAVVTFECNGKR